MYGFNDGIPGRESQRMGRGSDGAERVRSILFDWCGSVEKNLGLN
jgi:hypothetical protein